MWTRDYTQTGSQIALLVVQVFIILFCIGYIEHVYLVNIYPDKHVKENFDQTDCMVTAKRLSMKGHLLHQYRADFRITYTVNGVQYNKWLSGNGLDYSFTSNRAAEEDILNQYAEGGSYPCWYNPDDSSQVVLVLRHSWTSTFPLMVPSVVAVLTLYYFLKSFFQVTGKATIKARDIRRKRKERKNKLPQ